MKARVIVFFLVCAIGVDYAGAENAIRPKHFLWRVTNAPAPFYLVGALHALRRSDYYILHDFDGAIGQSQKFIFERDPNAADATVFWRKLMAETAYPRGVTIQQRIKPSTFALLRRIARIPMSAYETQKPWAIAFFNLKATGMERVSSRWSVDHYVYQKMPFRAETGGLETTDEFVRTFSEMNDRESESFLLELIEDGERSPELMNGMIATWESGNAQQMYRLCAPRRNGADGYWRWIERRNSLWLPRIENAINARRPTMVVVGALHLCGPRGVIAELRQRGYKLEQL
jgi:uncharacterized protein